VATLVEQLSEARDAYHALQTGRAAVRFRDSNGEDVTYTPANLAKLAVYIRELERQVGATVPINSIRFQTSKGV